ncbi:MAG: putative YbaB family protein [Chlamydiales bacterium]|nr:putative YbaB family protein [Chlamydiales bacterium]
MGSGFAKKKKQAKMLQEQLSQMQQQMSAAEVTGQAGGGLVEITLNGDFEMKGIRIQPECIDPEDKEGLELLIKTAYQEAMEKIKEQSMSNGMPDLNSLGGMGGLGSLGGLGGGFPFH